jgi:hypothetical protein
MTNVIAICPGEHREAHFGERRQEIEAEMIEKVRVAEARRIDKGPLKDARCINTERYFATR